MEDIGFNDGVEDGFYEPQAPEKIKWSESAALEHTTKLSAADPSLTEAEADQMADDLATTGGSALEQESVQAQTEEELVNRYDTAAGLALDFGGDAALAVLGTRINVDPVQLVDDNATAAVMAGRDKLYTFDEISAIMDKEQEIEAARQEMLRNNSVFEGTLAGDFFDFLGAAIPLRQQIASISVGNMLEEKYGIDAGSPVEALIANGEYLDDIRQMIFDLPPHQQLEAIRDIMAAARDASDWAFGPNDFVRMGITDQLLQQYDSGYNPEDLDLGRGINNVISVLDAMVVGKFAKNAINGLRTSRTVVGGIAETSNASKLTRLNPEAGAAVQGAALADDTARTAGKLGTTPEDIVLDSLLPMYEEMGYASKVSEGLVENAKNVALRLKHRRHDLAVDLTDAEKTAQAFKTEQTLSNLKGFNFRGNSSSISRTDNLIVATTRFGKTGSAGFQADEIADAVQRLQRLYPEANITTDVITHAGKVRSITAKAATKTDEELIELIKQELKVEAEGAVKRADTTGSKVVRGNLEGAKYDVKKANAMIRYLRGEKGSRSVPRKWKDEADALVGEAQSAGTKRLRATAVKDVVKQLQAQKLDAEKVGNRAVEAEKAAKSGATAKSELSRLEQGQDLKSPEWRRRLKQLREENTTTITREEAISDPTNEFFINMKFTKEFDTTEAMLNLDDIYVGGKYAHYLADISSAFDKKIAQTIIRGFDEAQGTEKIMAEALEPFMKAGREAKAFALNAIKRGDKEGVAYRAEDLINDMPTSFSAKQKQQALDAYYSFRTTSDMVYAIKNNKLRNILEQDGYLRVVAGDVETVGKPWTGAKPTQAYDPVTKSMRPVAEIEQEGAQIYKVKSRIQTGENNYSNFIVVKEGDEVSALPQQVLKYRDGYVPRIYDEQYFVTMKDPSAYVDGVKAAAGKAPTVQTYAAKSAKEAKELVARLKGENPALEVDYRNSRELTAGESVSAYFNVERSTGGLFYSKRGEHLRDAADELAEVANPIEAMQRMVSSSARELTLDPVMELMRKRWLSAFGHMTDGKYPTSVELIRSNKLRSPELSKAQAAWNFIENAQNGGATTRNWRANMVRLGEWVEEKGFDSLGKRIRTTERDPFSVARGITHLSTIVLNPMRQIFIQAQGVLLNAGVDGFASAMAKSHQAPALLMATAIGKGKRQAGMALVRKLGLEKDAEFMAMMKGLDESGLIQAIDSHLLTRDALRAVDNELASSVLGRGVQASKNALATTANTIRRYGFDLGEQMNITSTYMVAFNRYKVQNGIKGVFKPNAQQLADIAGDARQMALTMSAPGAMGYQKGVLSLATQFLAVQHKAWLAGARGIPGISKYGNKVYTVAEGRKILLGQTLLYGATGWGLSELIDKGMEAFDVKLSPEAREHLHGGIYDYVANSLIEAITGEDTNLAFSENIAAGGGFQRAITALIFDPIMEERPLPELFLGPTLNTVSKLGSIVDIGMSIMGTAYNGEHLTEEQIDLFKNSAARMVSGYNNWFKGQIALRVGTWVNKNGQIIDPSLEATGTEAWAQALFGITDAEVKDYYSTVQDIKATKDGIKQTAKDFVDRVEQTMAMYDTVGTEYGYMAELTTALKLENILLSVLDPADRQAVMKEVLSQLKYRGMQSKIVDQLTKAAISGSLGSDLPNIADDMLRKGLIEPQDHQRIMDFIGSEFK